MASVLPIILLGLLLKLVCFNGPLNSDDGRYLKFAEMLAEDGSISGDDNAASRLAWLLFIAFPLKLGLGLWGCYTFQIAVLTICEVWVAYVCFFRFGRFPSLIAAAWGSFNHISLLYDSCLLPDPILAYVIFGCCLLTPCTEQVATFRRSFLLGACVFVAYSIKDTGLLLLPPIFAIYALERQKRLLPVVALGFTFGLFLEMLVFFSATADPLFKFHVGARVSVDAIASQQARAGGPLNYLLIQFGRIIEPPTVIAMFGAFFVVFIAMLPSRGRTRNFGLIGLFLLLYSLFGSARLSSYMPLPKQIRYFFPLIPILQFGLAWLLTMRSFRQKVTAAIFSATVLIPQCLSALWNAGDIHQAQLFRQTLALLRDSPPGHPVVFSSKLDPYLVAMGATAKNSFPSKPVRVRHFYIGSSSDPPSRGKILRSVGDQSNLAILSNGRLARRRPELFLFECEVEARE